MRKLSCSAFTLLLFLCSISCTKESSQTVSSSVNSLAKKINLVGRQQQITIATSDYTYPTSQALLWLPKSYDSSNKRFPLIIALDGVGEQGGDINLLFHTGTIAGFIILNKRLPNLLKHIIQPIIIAFSTTSSEAVFPKLTEELERFGCDEKIVSFVLPLGYSFNLDGSMMYMTFASMAIAQAYHIQLDYGTQLTMLLVLMLTSKGIAGVPRASLVVVTATCAMFKIPPEGVALILPIDHFCDMFRTSTNVLGNALATSAVSKWEKALD